MQNRFRVLMGGMSLWMLLAFWSCGLNNAPDTGTSTSDPVSISTNRAAYKPGDEIQVSITNHLKTSIFALNSRASCTILDLQILVNSAWQNSQASPCVQASLAGVVEIPAGKTYHATIRAGISGVQSPGFPNGTYRLVFKYATTRTEVYQNVTTVYSASIVAMDNA